MAETKLSAKQIKKLAKAERKRQKRERKEARRADRLAKRVDVAYRSRLETEQVVALLEDITAGLKNGSVQLQHDGQQLSISPSDVVSVRVRARQTHKSEKLSIRVGWPRDVAADTEDIQISS